MSFKPSYPLMGASSKSGVGKCYDNPVAEFFVGY